LVSSGGLLFARHRRIYDLIKKDQKVFFLCYFCPANKTGGSPLRCDLTKKDQKIKAQQKFVWLASEIPEKNIFLRNFFVKPFQQISGWPNKKSFCVRHVFDPASREGGSAFGGKFVHQFVSVFA
jgi:hypothetical protein